MSFDLCILGSGSSGNCTLIRTPAGTMLIDMGFGPRTTASRLVGTGASVEDISAVCLTHLDSDHFNRNWLNTICRRAIRLHCHNSLVGPILNRARQAGLDDAFLRRLPSLIQPFDDAPFAPLDDLRIHPIPLPHDEAGSHGFLVESAAGRLGYATDLGRVPAALFDLFHDLDALALECNYDPAMQMACDRPWMLKQRVMGGHGHLSNQQSLAAVRHILDRCQKRDTALPSHIVLLHRSRQCNCPHLVRNLFSQDARIADRLILAEQNERTDWLRVDRADRLGNRPPGRAWPPVPLIHPAATISLASRAESPAGTQAGSDR